MARSACVDVVWTPDLHQALALPLSSFHAVVMDAPTPQASGAVARLEAAGAREVLVTSDPARYPAPADLPPRSGPQGEEIDPAGTPLPAGFIACSPAMRRTFALVQRACQTGATVLLSGETGTGKEVLARAIHGGSRRCREPFVAVNCAAFPDTLLESELFGHVRGAFTGADRARAGLFETASGGTLFLDEIGETSRSLQAKLLRALQEREIRPLGGTRTRKVDVRVVAATNRDLLQEVESGHFREDLYYRLAVFPIRVPPLRERREDIPVLAEHFLRLHGQRDGKPGCRLAKEASGWLLAHSWPGNVRELENEIQRALALSEPGDEIPGSRLSERLTSLRRPAESLRRGEESLRASLDRIEAWLLRSALEDHGGRRAETARALGITREGLYKKLKRLGIQ